MRDGITEDVITELSKIRGLNIFSRPTILAFRDKPMTPSQIAEQLGAAYVLTGTLRRAGARLRINAQLVDTRTDFPSLVGALRLRDEGRLRSAGRNRPQDRRGSARDAFSAGTRGPRRQAHRKPASLRSLPARQKIRAAADSPGPRVCSANVRERRGHGPQFRAGICRLRQRLRHVLLQFQPRSMWVERAREASGKAVALRWDLPEVQVSQAWVLYAAELHDEAVRMVKKAIERKRDCEGAYYLLCRALFAAGRYQEVVDVAERPSKRAARTTTFTCRS